MPWETACTLLEKATVVFNAKLLITPVNLLTLSRNDGRRQLNGSVVIS